MNCFNYVCSPKEGTHMTAATLERPAPRPVTPRPDKIRNLDRGTPSARPLSFEEALEKTLSKK